MGRGKITLAEDLVREAAGRAVLKSGIENEVIGKTGAGWLVVTAKSGPTGEVRTQDVIQAALDRFWQNGRRITTKELHRRWRRVPFGGGVLRVQRRGGVM